MPYECPTCGRVNVSLTCENVHVPAPPVGRFRHTLAEPVAELADDPFEGLDLDSSYDPLAETSR